MREEKSGYQDDEPTAHQHDRGRHVSGRQLPAGCGARVAVGAARSGEGGAVVDAGVAAHPAAAATNEAATRAPRTLVTPRSMRTSTCLSHPLSAWVRERWPRSVRGGTCQLPN